MAIKFLNNSSVTGQLIVTSDTNNVARIVQTDTLMSNSTYTFEVDSSSHVSNMSAAGAMAVDVYSGRAFTITGAGKVGVGTASPAQKFVVADSTNGDGIELVPGSTSVIQAFDRTAFLYNNLNIDTLETRVRSIGATIFNNGSGFPERMRITSTGNVGIGTTSPVAKLDVLGTNSGPTVFDYSYATNAGLRIHGDESAMDIVGTDAGDHASTILLRNGNEGFGLLNNPNLNVLQFKSFTASADGFAIHSTGSGLSSLVDIITLEKTGNVGIGTTSPSQKLEVDGAIKVTNTFTGETSANSGYFDFSSVTSTARITTKGSDGSTLGKFQILQQASDGSPNNTPFYIDSDSNVGIGTTNPGSLLHVEGSRTTASLQVNQTGTGVIANFKQGGSSKVLIDNTGNVGIGTTNPATWKLSVDSSNIYAASFDTSNNVGVVINGNNTTASQIIGFSNSNSTYNELHLRTNSTSTDGLYIDASGNVGIGTTNPSEKLDVVGNIELNGVLYIGSRGIYQQENTDVSGLELVANASISLYRAAFFDYVIQKAGNVRAGTVFACNDGVSVEYTETSTNDIGDTSDVVLSVDISAGNMRLLADAATSGWSVKSLIRAI